MSERRPAKRSIMASNVREHSAACSWTARARGASLARAFHPGFQDVKAFSALGLKKRPAIRQELALGQVGYHPYVPNRGRVRLKAGEIGELARAVDDALAHDLGVTCHVVSSGVT